MKIKLSYLSEEEAEAAAAMAALQALYPRIRVRKSDRHPPFKHIYLTTRKPENPKNTKEKP